MYGTFSFLAILKAHSIAVSHCGLIWIFLIIKDVEHLFITLFSICFHITIWMNLKHITLNESTPTQKEIYIHIQNTHTHTHSDSTYTILWKRQNYRDRNRLVIAKVWEWEKGLKSLFHSHSFSPV